VNIFPPVPKSFSKAAEDAHMVKNVQVFLDVVKYVEVVSNLQSWARTHAVLVIGLYDLLDPMT
jgi:hypothetical protein